MPTPAAIATAEWFYEIRHKPTQFPANVAENARAERDYLLNLWADEIDKRLAALNADKARLDWLDMRHRVTWSAAEKDPMDMRLTPIRQAIDDRK